MKFSFIGLLLIIIGALYLLNNLGILKDFNIDLGYIWSIYWPALLIILGIGMFFEKRSWKNKD